MSMGFSRQEYWTGLPFPSPGDLPDPRDQTRVSCIVGRRVWGAGVLLDTCLDKSPSPEAGGTDCSPGLTQPGSISLGWAAGLLGTAGPSWLGKLCKERRLYNASPADSLPSEPPVGRDKFKRKGKKKRQSDPWL